MNDKLVVLVLTRHYPTHWRRACVLFEREFLSSALRLCDGNVKRTAEVIGMDRRNLQRKLRLLEIDPKVVRENGAA